MKKIVAIVLALSLVFALGSVSLAADDNYPSKPITLVCPFSAGGSIDTLCRTLAPFLADALGTSVAVEDMPGAGSMIGLNYMVTVADKEGYTISEISEPHMSFTIGTQDATYTADSFCYLGMIQVDPCLLMVLNESKFETLQDMITYIEEHPGEVAIGCTQASGPQVVMYAMQKQLGLDFTIVTYSGGGEGRAALVGNHIDAYFAFAQASYSFIDVCRGLAIGADERSPLWPDCPTFEEALEDGSELNSIAKSMAAYRSIALPAEFAEKYPERYKLLCETLDSIFHSEEYQEACKTSGQLEIMEWHDPAETLDMLHASFDLMTNYFDYFK